MWKFYSLRTVTQLPPLPPCILSSVIKPVIVEQVASCKTYKDEGSFAGLEPVSAAYWFATVLPSASRKEGAPWYALNWYD